MGKKPNSRLIFENEAKIQRLNDMLRVVNGVNQLIIREKDRHSLIQGVCDILSKKHGYYQAWVVLLDANRKFLAAVESGMGKTFFKIFEKLSGEQLPVCGDRVFPYPGVLVIEDSEIQCEDCLLSKECRDKRIIVIRLKHEDKIYGFMGVVTPKKYILDEKEIQLFEEVAADIALALHHIRTEEVNKTAKEMIYKLSWAVEQSPSLIILTDKDGKITYVNPKFTQLTGYNPEEAVGKNPFFLNSLEISDEECELLWQNTISSGAWEGDLNIRKKNGDMYWEAASISPIRNETGKLMGFLKVAEDITVHKLAIDKIAAAMDIKSRFISMVSHELRTPLTSIKEGIAIVLDGLTGPVNSDQKDFLDIAKRNVDRLSRLINNVLDFQKLESDKMEFYMERNDINEAIWETQKTIAPFAKEKGVDFIIELGESLPRVMFDKDKMIQVLMNIIGNAVKFTERGKVIVSTSKRKNLVEVSVQDTGCGISEEDIPKLFHKFEQLTRGKDRRTSGTGLGLAISKDIIEKHRGNLWVESEFGKGTTFRFVLPRR